MILVVATDSDAREVAGLTQFPISPWGMEVEQRGGQTPSQTAVQGILEATQCTSLTISLFTR